MGIIETAAALFVASWVFWAALFAIAIIAALAQSVIDAIENWMSTPRKPQRPKSVEDQQ